MAIQNPHFNGLIEAKRAYDEYRDMMGTKYGQSHDARMTVEEMVERTAVTLEYREQAGLFMVYDGV